MPVPATLHILCGKIASGKSTLARRLGAEPGTIVLSQDYLLSRLYPGEILDLPDFVRCSTRLREAIGPHIVAVLAAGVDVVLDFEANAPGSRGWMRGLFEAAGAAHVLHFLDATDETCLERLRARNASGTHEYQVSPEVFAVFTRYFTPPDVSEGFTVARIAVESVATQRNN